ncbi:MAG: riboflavin synthase [bacterium]|nr:MAG: riboflavin synthase [bacterium]
MFTGLIEEVGTVVSLRRVRSGGSLTVRTGLADLTEGESIAVSGVCQTVSKKGKGTFSCDLLEETMRATTLGLLRAGSLVNLERAVRPGDRMGGHFVSGHVDGTGTITAVSRRPLSIEIAVDSEMFQFMIPKGSVAVNGVSLTIGPELGHGRFTVFIIPFTWEHTNLHAVREGSKVNIEVDILGKYVYSFLRQGGHIDTASK